MASKTHSHFDGMTWPNAGERASDVGYRLRYADDIGMRDRVLAASIISAYIELVNCSQRKRQNVVRKLMANAAKPSAALATEAKRS